jgi:hypothetical protein
MNKTNAWLGILIFALAGCSQSPVETQIPTGMNLGWKSLPHRIAATELTTKLSSETPTITVQNDGGDFGAMDTATANYQTIAIAHPGLVIEEVSATFVIEPSTDPAAIDAYLQSQSLTLPASLNGSDNLAVFVRGFRIDTNLYETEPDFQTAEDLPYDPALGYTTGGFGMGSSDPVRTDSGWTIDVFARNRLAISDREDMNAAIEQATTWVRVDYLVMGLPEDVTLSRAETNYALSYPDFGSQTDHPHADAEKQTIVFDAQSNTDVLGFGINGPGRYLREFTTAISDVAPQNDGSVKALFDLHISNSSAMNEVGNICAGLSGKALLLRTPGATTPTIVNRRLQFESGITLEDSLND